MRWRTAGTWQVTITLVGKAKRQNRSKRSEGQSLEGVEFVTGGSWPRIEELAVLGLKGKSAEVQGIRYSNAAYET